MLPGHIAILPLIRFYEKAGKRTFSYALMAMRIDRTFWVSSSISSKFKNICLSTPIMWCTAQSCLPRTLPLCRTWTLTSPAVGSPDSTAGSQMGCSVGTALSQRWPAHLGATCSYWLVNVEWVSSPPCLSVWQFWRAVRGLKLPVQSAEAFVMAASQLNNFLFPVLVPSLLNTQQMFFTQIVSYTHISLIDYFLGHPT